MVAKLCLSLQGKNTEVVWGQDTEEDFWSKSELVEYNKLYNEEINNLYASSNIIRAIKSRRMRWTVHIARMGKPSVHATFTSKHWLQNANLDTLAEMGEKYYKIGKVYSLEYNDIPKVFFTPNHVVHCCTNVIQGHGCASGNSCTNVIRDHCCTITCLNNALYHCCATVSSNNDPRSCRVDCPCRKNASDRETDP
jgi:hypothetical protein